MWFSFDGENFHAHSTREEAQKAAQDALDEHRNEEQDEWPIEAYSVCWGRITEKATVVMEQAKIDGDWTIALTPTRYRRSGYASLRTRND